MKPPIFVVGTARSGTTLVASILDSHSHLSCGPETAFFIKLPASKKRAMVQDPAWPDKAVRFLMARERFSGKVAEQYGLEEAAVRAALKDRTPSLQAILEALTVTFAERRGRVRWAEKTPMHVLYLKEIRALWPEAPIVRIVRDPRGVAASHLHVPWGPRTVVGAAYNWAFHDESAHRFMSSDAKAMTIRYEDLLANTEDVVRHLCDFIGETFEPGMLAAGGSDTGTTATAGAGPVAPSDPGSEAWKTTRVIDAGRANAWQTELSAQDQARVATLCGDGMERHGYAGAIASQKVLLVQPYDLTLAGARGLLEEAADRRVSLQALPRRGWRSGRKPILFYGAPGTLRWTQRGSGGIRALALWTRSVWVARLRGRTLLWIEDRGVREPWHSLTERACDTMLRLAVRKSEPAAAMQRVSDA